MSATEEPQETPQEKHSRLTESALEQGLSANAFLPDWTRACEACGASPVLPATGMCGPCSFGEAETFGGNW